MTLALSEHRPHVPLKHRPVSTRYISPFVALPWQVDPWRDMSPVALLAGPAGTGKSRLWAEKLHAALLRYSGTTGLAVRKTRESMTNSTVLFLDRMIIGKDPRVRHAKAEHRFEYVNGSILAYGGMKDEEQREQIRGIGIDAGIDFVWMEEATRFVEDDFNEITARMRGRAAGWTQVMLSTNPGPPSHWINKRLILGGEATVYDKARPEDNPFNPLEYIERLKRLTGILRMRLWDGLWVQAEGLVFPEFDLDNLTDDEPDYSQPFEISFDEGYIDPRAILFIQKRPTGVLIFDEIYHTHHLAEVCVREIIGKSIEFTLAAGNDKLAGALEERPYDEMRSIPLEALGQWCREMGVVLPEIAIGSPEAKEIQGRLRLADIPYRSRSHEVVEGIKKMRDLILDGNGQRALTVNRRCKSFISEITEGYIYPEGRKAGSSEKPVDKNNHAMDSFRYWVWMRI